MSADKDVEHDDSLIPLPTIRAQVASLMWKSVSPSSKPRYFVNDVGNDDCHGKNVSIPTLKGVHSMALPKIDFDFGPPSRKANFESPDIECLDPPSRHLDPYSTYRDPPAEPSNESNTVPSTMVRASSEPLRQESPRRSSDDILGFEIHQHDADLQIFDFSVSDCTKTEERTLKLSKGERLPYNDDDDTQDKPTHYVTKDSSGHTVYYPEAIARTFGINGASREPYGPPPAAADGTRRTPLKSTMNTYTDPMSSGKLPRRVAQTNSFKKCREQLRIIGKEHHDTHWSRQHEPPIDTDLKSLSRGGKRPTEIDLPSQQEMIQGHTEFQSSDFTRDMHDTLVPKSAHSAHLTQIGRNRVPATIATNTAEPLESTSMFSSDQSKSKVLSHTIPSDSGYHSGLGTDSEPVCSVDSVESFFGLPQDFLQEFIAFFGDKLIEKTDARQWVDITLKDNATEVAEWKLNTLLKEYTMELSSKPPGSWVSESIQASQQVQNHANCQVLAGAIKLVHHYRPRIARYFLFNAISLAVSDKPQSLCNPFLNERLLLLRLRMLEKRVLLDKRFGFSAKFARHAEHPTESAMDLQEDDEMQDNGDDGEFFADLEAVCGLLVSNEAFQRLTLDLRRTLYLAMEKVRFALLENRTDPLHTVDVVINSNFPDFMRSQYGQEFPSIGQVVVLTGTALYAQATTCVDYVTTTWPKLGTFVIDIVDSYLRGARHDTPQTFESRLYVYVDSLDSDGLKIYVSGNEETIVVDFVQQLAWMGSALSNSPFGDELAYAKTVVYCTSSPQQFEIKIYHQPICTEEAACWLPLFSGASIAYGFPIPDRVDEMGLEIPLELLAGIAGVRHAVEYEGGVVLKGFSHIFVPVRKKDDRVQWHAISSQDPDSRLTYRDGLARCQSRAFLHEVSLNDIQSCRAIVGWCSVATSRLGSDLANYENIDYSGAKEADSVTRCAGGSLGFQQFGTAALDFKFGLKEGKCHFQRSGPYQRIISAAEKTPVVLYDTGEQRAWLVPASNVILHLIQHRHRLEPYEMDGKSIRIDTNVAVNSTAKSVLLNNRSLRLSDDEQYTFQDNVLNIWSLLEFLIDENVARDRSTSGATIKNPLREYLHGFEFKAITEERSPFRQKQTLLEKSNGGWLQLVRDIDALVLFANGFEDIIVPVEPGIEHICSSWLRVPKGNDYLATSTKTLKELYDVAGCRLSRQYLTSSQLQWHQGDSILFDACEDPQACHCDRLQRICSKSSLRTIIPPGHIVDQGAVIFGRSATKAQNLISKPYIQARKVAGIYSQPNLSLTPIVIQEDTEDAAFSDDDFSGRNNSDAPTDTTFGSVSSCTTLLTQDVPFGIHDVDLETRLTSKSRKRNHIPALRHQLPGKDEHERVYEHRRPKNMDVFDSQSALPIQYHCGRPRNDDHDQRHGRLDSILQRTDLTLKAGAAPPDSLRDAPLSLVSDDQTGDHVGIEGRTDSVSLVARLADDQPPRALRRREGFTLGSRHGV